jgi:hypothetical protein
LNPWLALKPNRQLAAFMWYMKGAFGKDDAQTFQSTWAVCMELAAGIWARFELKYHLRPYRLFTVPTNDDENILLNQSFFDASPCCLDAWLECRSGYWTGARRCNCSYSLSYVECPPAACCCATLRHFCATLLHVAALCCTALRPLAALWTARHFDAFCFTLHHVAALCGTLDSFAAALDSFAASVGRLAANITGVSPVMPRSQG